MNTASHNVIANVAESAAVRASLDNRLTAYHKLTWLASQVRLNRIALRDARRILGQYRSPIGSRFAAWRATRGAMPAFVRAATVALVVMVGLASLPAGLSAHPAAGSSLGSESAMTASRTYSASVALPASPAHESRLPRLAGSKLAVVGSPVSANAVVSHVGHTISLPHVASHRVRRLTYQPTADKGEGIGQPHSPKPGQ